MESSVVLQSLSSGDMIRLVHGSPDVRVEVGAVGRVTRNNPQLGNLMAVFKGHEVQVPYRFLECVAKGSGVSVQRTIAKPEQARQPSGGMPADLAPVLERLVRRMRTTGNTPEGLFMHLDIDKNKHLSKEEFRIGLQDFVRGEEMVGRLFRYFDHDGNGFVCFDEFVTTLNQVSAHSTGHDSAFSSAGYPTQAGRPAAAKFAPAQQPMQGAPVPSAPSRVVSAAGSPTHRSAAPGSTAARMMRRASSASKLIAGSIVLDDDDEHGEVIIDEGRSALHLVSGSYEWLRKANGLEDRDCRQKAAALTMRACKNGGYRICGKEVKLVKIEAMLQGTELIRASEAKNILARRPPSTQGGKSLPTWAKHAPGVAMQVAVEKQKAKAQVAVINAASAYHVGGGFFEGGRHALEESMCMQSALLKSLHAAESKAKAAGVKAPSYAVPRLPRHGGEWHCHVPEDGAILSPHVEVFRAGTTEGYPFLDEATCLTAIVSIAMPNCNDRVRDAPYDKPPSPEAYRTLLQQKFTAMLAACLMANADTIVLPDVGCGVYGNDPEDVGFAFGRALASGFSHVFRDIHIVGGKEFAAAAEKAFASAGAAEVAMRRGGARDFPSTVAASAPPTASGRSI
mmetsp:Transcript_55307/g.131932  ORF Transcript_55307/g.131932 Transcript_55307/m.131932 type:complete len:623 (+) Transcript_55307:82-1950(+)